MLSRLDFLARYRAIRRLTKPSTANCDLNTYPLFLLSELRYAGCKRLSSILEDVSHDSVNRFLKRERYTPQDLFTVVKPLRILVTSGSCQLLGAPSKARLCQWSVNPYPVSLGEAQVLSVVLVSVTKSAKRTQGEDGLQCISAVRRCTSSSEVHPLIQQRQFFYLATVIATEPSSVA